MRDTIAKFRGALFVLRSKLAGKAICVGEGLKIKKKLRIDGPGSVSIGRNCTIAGISGDHSQYVTIDTHDPDAVIRIGDNACLHAARISAKYEILIGNDVIIEESGIVDTDFHSIRSDRGAPLGENREKCRITIGDRVGIGARSYIAKGVTVGDDVLIVPGSIVTMSLRPNCTAGGNPAKQLPTTV
jgi:UDP-3-O-[3-hydroxymyristoyl] glucosamine N-acyltransferase